MTTPNMTRATPRRMVALWLPTFATDRLERERRREGELLATVTAAHGGLRVASANREAQAVGVTPGLPLADARALAPGLVTSTADPNAERRDLEALADWCGRYTPWTAVDAPGGIWLDITGCAHLFGGEEALLRDLTHRLTGLGYPARAVVADTAGAAWALARFGAVDVLEVTSGTTRDVLAPLPVAALRLPPDTVAGLSRVGLRRIGDLLDIPRAPLAARFGEATLSRLDQALGHDDEVPAPRHPQPLHQARLAFAEPIGRTEDVILATRSLLEKIGADLARAHQGLRRMKLTVHRVDGTSASLTTGTNQPVRDPDHLERLILEKLDHLDAGFGIEVMTVAVLITAPLAPVQDDLVNGSGAGSDSLSRLVDRLGARLGSGRVVRLESLPSHLPERACREVPALQPPPPALPSSLDSHAPRAPRPLHLLPWPEPVEVAAPPPDGAPLVFQRRRVRHRVLHAEGPERIAPEWWVDGAPPPEQGIRDYYRVEDEDGRRFWLYREGLPLPGVRPRWYLHGVFP